jgi:dTDP-glucose pyrophosphorylase
MEHTMEIEKMIISEECTILEALKHLDEVATKVLFVVEKGSLKAALTDGDVRRWILKKGDLNEKVKNVANYSPLYLVNADRQQALKYMREKKVEALPILDENGRIKSIVLWDENEIVVSRQLVSLPVVIMAGGLGKRLYPYTNILPKPLIPVGEIPIAEHIINQFCSFGCKDYYLIVNHKKNMIKAYFNEIEKEYNIYYIDEDKPLGTGGGLSLMKGKIKSTFILTNCDILIREDFNKVYQLHKEKKNIITMICSLKNFAVPYGVVEIGEHGEIESMREKPELSFFTNTGCYIVEPEVIDELEYNVSIGFPDIIEKYKNQGKNVGVYPIGEKAWLDMGQLDELEKMKTSLGC